MKKRNLMIAGTMSGVGKSLITAGLCRIYTRRGYSVAPFKSQNMALNSYVTYDGGEIGTATALQALACRKEPVVEMNPILLKPLKDTESQVIVNGAARKNMPARDYYRMKASLIPTIVADYNTLAENNDLVVIEGAGSCAELNLMKNDIVNLGLAKQLDAPVLLVGDIDRGGIFAQLYGTIDLLPPEYSRLIKAVIVNKFRGDISIFSDGVDIIEKNTRRRVAGVLPYTRLDLPEEDSLSKRLQNTEVRDIDIAVLRLPRISNYTDFMPLERYPEVSVRYVTSTDTLKNPDMIILPGTKNTSGDLKYLRESGLFSAVKRFEGKIPIMGICGGFQMLGRKISDPDGIEEGGEEQGFMLIPMDTRLEKAKVTRRVSGKLNDGSCVSGYEIHAGISGFYKRHTPLIRLEDGNTTGYIDTERMIAGTYMHGFFDEAGVADKLIHFLAKRKGIEISTHFTKSQREETDEELDRLADVMEENLDMDLIDQIIRG